MPLQPLTFTSDFGSYPLDDHPEGHPGYGESTESLIESGDYAVNGIPILRDGVVDFNGRAGASSLGVQEPSSSAGANSYTLWCDFTIQTPGTRNIVVVMSISSATTEAPSGGLLLWYTRNGVTFGISGQAVEHTRSLHGYSGGMISWHVEVDPGSGQWYCEVSTGASLAYQACGLSWDAGLLTGATFGQASFGGFAPNAVLTTTAAGGDTAVRVGLPDCPIPPEGAARRTQAIWLPWGQ